MKPSERIYQIMTDEFGINAVTEEYIKQEAIVLSLIKYLDEQSERQSLEKSNEKK